MSLCSRTVFVAFVFCLAAPAALAQNYTLAPFVLRGDAAPGTPGTPGTFSSFDLPFSVTESDVAFAANLLGQPAGSTRALFADVGAGLELVAITGMSAPGLPGAHMTGLLGPQLNASGEVVYFAATSDGSEGIDAIYRWKDGNTTLLVKEGDPAPGAGLTFSHFAGPVQNDAGDLVFLGQVLEPSGSSLNGIFRWSGGVVTALLWEYVPAPGTDGGVSSFGQVHLNASGDIAFAANVTSASVGHGLFKVSGGVLETLVLEGDVLPGTTGGTATRLNVSIIGLNAAGIVSFVADVVGGSVDRGIFVVSGGLVSPVALEGDPAPNSGGATYGFLRRNVAIDAAGKVAFMADLVGGSASQGLFRGGQAVALIGDPLPGTGGGVGPMSERPAMTASGGVGFQTDIFQGVGGRGLFRGTPPVPAVPGPSPVAAGVLGPLLVGWGARRLAHGSA